MGLVPFWVLRHSFLSLPDCWWLYNIQLKTSRGVLFLPPSDACVRSFLCLLYTLINLYYTKALSDQASSLALDWILLWRPRILASFRESLTTFQYDNPLQYSCLGNPMDREDWWATVHGVTDSQTQLRTCDHICLNQPPVVGICVLSMFWLL